MSTQVTLQYKELTREDITEEVVTNINRLLPQLSKKPRQCSTQQLHKMLNSGVRAFLALDGATVVGTTLYASYVTLADKKCWIEEVIVDSEYRGHGIAHTLLDMAEQACREDGATSISLTSNVERHAARKLYESRGYTLRNTSKYTLVF